MAGAKIVKTKYRDAKKRVINKKKGGNFFVKKRAPNGNMVIVPNPVARFVNNKKIATPKNVPSAIRPAKV